jgi:type III secretory pathway lipoprotein EscJ
MSPHIRQLIICTLLLLSGCNEILFHDLTEHEAHKALALLHQVGIPGEKELQHDSRWSISVPDQQRMKAIEILTQYRVIREKKNVAQAQGSLMPSKEEQRRVAQETLSTKLEETLQGLPGVIDVRVHIYEQEQDVFSPKLSAQKSASVMMVVEYLASIEEVSVKAVISGATGISRDNVAVVVSRVPQLSVPTVQVTNQESTFSQLIATYNKAPPALPLGILSGCVMLIVFFIYGVKSKRRTLIQSFKRAEVQREVQREVQSDMNGALIAQEEV